MYFDEDEDLAHKFHYEERVKRRSGEVTWRMRKIVDHFRPPINA